jgi:hypothetical protein
MMMMMMMMLAAMTAGTCLSRTTNNDSSLEPVLLSLKNFPPEEVEFGDFLGRTTGLVVLSSWPLEL